MDTDLTQKIAVAVVSLSQEGHRLDTGFLTLLEVHDLGLVSPLFGPSQVHPQQHLGPILALGASGARMDRDDGVAGIVLPREKRVQFGLGEPFLKVPYLLPDIFVDVLPLPLQFNQHLQVLQSVPALAGQLQAAVQITASPENVLGFLRPGPEGRIRNHFLDLSQFLFLGFDVKDTPKGCRSCSSDPDSVPEHPPWRQPPYACPADSGGDTFRTVQFDQNRGRCLTAVSEEESVREAPNRPETY